MISNTASSLSPSLRATMRRMVSSGMLMNDPVASFCLAFCGLNRSPWSGLGLMAYLGAPTGRKPMHGRSPMLGYATSPMMREYRSVLY